MLISCVENCSHSLVPVLYAVSCHRGVFKLWTCRMWSKVKHSTPLHIVQWTQPRPTHAWAKTHPCSVSRQDGKKPVAMVNPRMWVSVWQRQFSPTSLHALRTSCWLYYIMVWFISYSHKYKYPALLGYICSTWWCSAQFCRCQLLYWKCAHDFYVSSKLKPIID